MDPGMDVNLLVRLIILLPLVGAVLCGLGGLFIPQLRGRETLIGSVATLMVAIPFAITVYLFSTYAGAPLVTGVGAVILLSSTGYMPRDPGYWRFFAYLNLFIFAMLNLVLANNLVVMFRGGEGVGLCSYLLIGYWYEDLKNSEAANKAFIMNRVGDFAFLMAMFILYKQVGSLEFGALLDAVDTMPQATLNWAVLLLFIGATG